MLSNLSPQTSDFPLVFTHCVGFIWVQFPAPVFHFSFCFDASVNKCQSALLFCRLGLLHCREGGTSRVPAQGEVFCRWQGIPWEFLTRMALSDLAESLCQQWDYPQQIISTRHILCYIPSAQGISCLPAPPGHAPVTLPDLIKDGQGSPGQLWGCPLTVSPLVLLQCLKAEDMANAVIYVLSAPPHVQVGWGWGWGSSGLPWPG